MFPFLAAVLILASASNEKPNITEAVEVPTLEPTSLLVAFTGKVMEQEVRTAPIISIQKLCFNAFNNFIR